MTPFHTILPTGAFLPEWTLHTDSFQVLATFVALNSLMYATLALLKVLPKGYAFSRFNGRNRRVENRSIYPEPPTTDSLENRERASAPADDQAESGHQSQDAPNHDGDRADEPGPA